MNRERMERLFAEWGDDAAQRPLRDKGVRYEDEPGSLKELREAAGKVPEPEQGKGVNRGVEM